MDLSCDIPARKAFLELVRCGAMGSAPDPALFRGLTAGDWETIYTLARRQTVCGLCYSAYCVLPDSLLPAGPVLPRWVARVEAIEDAGRRMACAVRELVDAFRRAGLHPVVQKGLSVARFYPAPGLRECGDIDLWFPESEMSAAVALVAAKGRTVTTHPDGSRSFSFRGFVVELHRRLISISAPRASRRLAASVARMCADSVPAADLPSPLPLLELLLIDVHIMRHAFGTGIGLRQICDYMLAADRLRGRYDRAEFARMCAALGISRWTALLNAFTVRYLGADAASLPPSGCEKEVTLPVEDLMRIVLEGGNFGHHSASGALRRRGKSHTVAMLVRRSRFAFSVAPAEAFWNIVRLTFGQFK